MKVASFYHGDRRVKDIAESTDNTFEFDSIKGYACFRPLAAEMYFAGPHYEPRLTVSGYVDTVLIDQSNPLPFGITELTFNPEDKPKIVADYSFNTEELKQLVDKGLYLSEFEAPSDELCKYEWQLNYTTPMTIVSPRDYESAPLVTVDPEPLTHLDISSDNSYVIIDVFEDVRQRMMDQGKETEHEKHAEDEIVYKNERDLLFGFADEEMNQRRQQTQKIEGTELENYSELFAYPEFAPDTHLVLGDDMTEKKETGAEEESADTSRNEVLENKKTAKKAEAETVGRHRKTEVDTQPDSEREAEEQEDKEAIRPKTGRHHKRQASSRKRIQQLRARQEAQRRQAESNQPQEDESEAEKDTGDELEL